MRTCVAGRPRVRPCGTISPGVRLSAHPSIVRPRQGDRQADCQQCGNHQHQLPHNLLLKKISTTTSNSFRFNQHGGRGGVRTRTAPRKKEEALPIELPFQVWGRGHVIPARSGMTKAAVPLAPQAQERCQHSARIRTRPLKMPTIMHKLLKSQCAIAEGRSERECRRLAKSPPEHPRRQNRKSSHPEQRHDNITGTDNIRYSGKRCTPRATLAPNLIGRLLVLSEFCQFLDGLALGLCNGLVTDRSRCITGGGHRGTCRLLSPGSCRVATRTGNGICCLNFLPLGHTPWIGQPATDLAPCLRTNGPPAMSRGRHRLMCVPRCGGAAPGATCC